MIDANLQSRLPCATWTGRILSGILVLFLAKDTATQVSAMPHVSLAVRDLKRSTTPFGKLGFESNPQFTGENATSMIVDHDAFVTLLSEPFVRTFTKRKICDTTRPRDPERHRERPWKQGRGQPCLHQSRHGTSAPSAVCRPTLLLVMYPNRINE
jgi:hypothetical protein